ncbi:MAG: lysylphosphatidylglycerol synthase domain-containing protein [Actinomycetota bacterium]
MEVAARPRWRVLAWVIGLAFLAASLSVIARNVDLGALGAVWATIRSSPQVVAAILGIYGLAFVVRALTWRATLPDLPLRQALAAIHLSLAGNHVLPFRLGEALRVTSVVRRAGVPLPLATSSTVTLRAADLLGAFALVALLGPGALQAPGILTAAIVVLAAAAGVLGAMWLRRISRSGSRMRVRMPGLLVAAGASAAWVFEAAVIWEVTRWTGTEITISQAVLVTVVTIAAQTLAIAPGGFGTYEAAATAALSAMGLDPGTALAAALGAHALKTIYALATGTVAFFLPAPGLVGRLRLPPGRATRAGAHHPGPAAARGCPPPSPAAGPGIPAPPLDEADALLPPAPGVSAPAVAAGPKLQGHDLPDPDPVVLFLPARDEEESVGAIVARTPPRIQGHPVRCLVIDDGSQDRTAEVAAAAGAEVISLGGPWGLGAAVRRGLLEATRAGAVAVAFCDADGEYAPEELERLVAPILRGEADYVVGSRFAGASRRMPPHRLVGNLVLTRALARVARCPITDGQSGYRALSAPAAAAAEVIHDFNYAQVLTLDLLAKGFRYREVPITYGFRRAGRSFVRLGPYLRAVVPAIYRELNSPSRAAG